MDIDKEHIRLTENEAVHLHRFAVEAKLERTATVLRNDLKRYREQIGTTQRVLEELFNKYVISLPLNVHGHNISALYSLASWHVLNKATVMQQLPYSPENPQGFTKTETQQHMLASQELAENAARILQLLPREQLIE